VFSRTWALVIWQSLIEVSPELLESVEIINVVCLASGVVSPPQSSQPVSSPRTLIEEFG